MTHRSHKSLILFLAAMLLLFLAVPAFAQDATAESPPIVAPDAPVVTDITVEEGGQLTIEQQTPLSPAPADDISISNDTLLIVGVLIVGFISIAVAVSRGKNPDTAAATQLQTWQMNREFMAAQERAYQNNSAERRLILDTAATIVTALAPLTTFLKSDDALAKYLRDIQTPGPESPPVEPLRG